MRACLHVCVGGGGGGKRHDCHERVCFRFFFDVMYVPS